MTVALALRMGGVGFLLDLASADMKKELVYIAIKITSNAGETYKSIGDLKWENIPGLAILTGRNGSGKTQLLEILTHHLIQTIPPEISQVGSLPVSVKIDGDVFLPHEVGYIPSQWRFAGGAETNFENLKNIRTQAIQLAANIGGYSHDPVNKARAYRLRLRTGGRPAQFFSSESMREALPDDFQFAIDDVDVTQGLAHVFLAHRLRVIDAIAAKRPGYDLDGREIGVPPWEVVNDLLKAADFQYRIVSPDSMKSIFDSYKIQLIDVYNNKVVNANDLSSGEKVLLQLGLWLFSVTKDGAFPRLLLLDEPDAHLHPSMTVQFLKVISEVLVERYGVRVIMTTHSPSTVALAPEGSVFRIDRGATEVVQVSSRADVISNLTAGLVTVSRATKFCFVEDESDVGFYEVVRDLLMDQGPSKDSMALKSSPSIVFLPASIGKGANKISGGWSVVEKWVNKLDADPLDRMFYGIIDRDVANQTSGRVFAIGRYSFENYLLDPIVLYTLLLEEGKAPAVANISISHGDEHRLRALPTQDIEAISNAICRALQVFEPSLLSALELTVKYTNGIEIKVPKWVLDHRGHDLLPIAQKAFGGGLVTPPRLRKALQRCRFVPEELAQLLARIQNL